MLREGKEHISFAGRLNNDTLNNLKIHIKNFDVNDINSILFQNDSLKYILINAMLDSISMVLNGTLVEPRIESAINISNIKYENLQIGQFNASVNYLNNNLSGIAKISNKQNELFTMIINSIPIYLGFDTLKSLFKETSPIDISIYLNELNAGFFSPFVPSVKDINGKLVGMINIGGYLPDKFEYGGNVKFDNLQFTIEPINMQYVAFGEILLKTELISFDNLKVKNIYQDLKNGEITIKGNIELEKFNLKHIDISASTKNFQVLSDKTETVMP